MANIDGLPVNSAVTHAEFMSRTQDTSTVSKISLLDPDVASGASISNVQKAINKAFEGVGTTGESDTTINDYSSNNYILDGDNRKEAIEKLDAQLGTTQAQLTALDAINSQDVSLGAIGSTPNANGSTLTGQVLNLEPANASFGGVVTTGAQTFAGDKTFQNNVIVTGDLTVNGTTTTINSTTVSTADKNIEINIGGNDASSEGAGLTTKRTTTDGSLIYKNASATRHAAGDIGSEVDLVGTTSTQTLTNKTISGASNTITNVSLASGVTGTLPIANGGTGQTAQTAAFDALSPLTTKGDLIVNDGTNDIRLAVGTNTHVLTADSTQASGVKWAAAASGSVATPTVQKFTSGSGTYTKPVGVTYIRVTMVGGGGSPTVSGVGAGNAGAASTFGTSLLSAGGGAGSTTSFGASGGASSLGTGPIGIALPGGGGGSGGITNTGSGGQGGSSAFGGAGIGGYTGISTGTSGGANTGGGGGGNANAGGPGSGGGGAGGYVCALIISPSATYSYAVGAGGAALSGGSAGGSGLILVEEYY